MAGFNYQHQSTAEALDPPTAARNARYGAVLFFIYLMLYGGFVALCAFRPAAMETIVLSGLNLAIVYGLGLIAAAFALALVYGWLCRAPAREINQATAAADSATESREQP